jgi:hypothetical protein
VAYWMVQTLAAPPQQSSSLGCGSEPSSQQGTGDSQHGARSECSGGVGGGGVGQKRKGKTREGEEEGRKRKLSSQCYLAWHHKWTSILLCNNIIINTPCMYTPWWGQMGWRGTSPPAQRSLFGWTWSKMAKEDKTQQSINIASSKLIFPHYTWHKCSASGWQAHALPIRVHAKLNIQWNI